ncbi:ATP-dependent helicase [Roseomonas mucosa]|uniref:ATP-dependent helicase n=1 Tax=Roseomonas mucosa TaxID=207340 RepID=UPI001D599457|nr:UvrD-helicase domain-containing protein [Roseomonas mucosa]MBS5905232.1 UvrD-helicase domain-containing protein [Acetobacteraceae bacterium]MCG7353112.1 UvrD-helicase domain-containing protein [Roseomonas mucosa]
MPAASDTSGHGRLVAGLTRAQAEAAGMHGPVLVLAGAGTGKTKTLTAGVALRIAERGIPASRILAVTFTNKAASEMRARIVALLGDQSAPSWIGTFHGLGARQLRLEPEMAGLREGFDVLDADDSRRLLKRTLKSLGAEADDEALGKDPVKAIAGHIGRFKDALVTPGEASIHAEAIIAGDRLADVSGLRAAVRIYPEYQSRLTEANAADFGDLLLWPVVCMGRDEERRQRFASRFSCILADEYQDVNAVQYRWLRLMARDHGEIFAVGDDDQAVFGWRGADIEYIRRFTRDFRGAAVVKLEENFRSTGHILAAANAVIAREEGRLGKTLRPTREQGQPIEVVRFRNDEAEATGLVAEIRKRGAEGVRWHDMAILYRANHLSRGIEEELLRAKVPYVLVGDVGFYQRAEIKDALALLRLAASPDEAQSDEAFRRACNSPPRGIGPKALDLLERDAEWRGSSLLAACHTAELPPKVRGAAGAFADAVRSVAADTGATVADRLSMLLDRTGYRQSLRDSRAETVEGRLENLAELVLLAGGFHSSAELLEHAALASAAPGEEAEGRVQLLTLHRAKGLEFPHVFLPAWNTSIFPSQYGDAAEERRLAYVALTRGKERVAVSYAEFRRGYVDPSPFLEDIPEANRHQGWLRPEERRPPRPSPRQVGMDALNEMLAGLRTRPRA